MGIHLKSTSKVYLIDVQSFFELSSVSASWPKIASKLLGYYAGPVCQCARMQCVVGVVFCCFCSAWIMLFMCCCFLVFHERGIIESPELESIMKSSGILSAHLSAAIRQTQLLVWGHVPYLHCLSPLFHFCIDHLDDLSVWETCRQTYNVVGGINWNFDTVTIWIGSWPVRTKQTQKKREKEKRKRWKPARRRAAAETAVCKQIELFLNSMYTSSRQPNR